MFLSISSLLLLLIINILSLTTVRIRPVKNACFSSMSCNFANKKVQNNEQLII